MKIFYDHHYTGAEHAFDTTRKSAAIADAVGTRQLDGVHLCEPSVGAIAAATAGIHHMHSIDYVEALRTGDDQGLAGSQGFQWCPGIWTMAVHSTAGVIAATDAALVDGVAGSLSSGLHHAKPDHGEGFCTVNGLAIASARLAADGKRVVVLDFDAHCGGGTAAMIATHDLGESIRHLDLSTNRFDRYEATHPDDRLVIESGGDSAYIDAAEQMLDEIDWASTDIVLYNAGVDIHPGLGRLTVATRERLVFERASTESTPIAWVLAGGYTWGITMDELVDLHWQTIDAATGLVTTGR